jgi:putative glutamine amidotransferase
LNAALIGVTASHLTSKSGVVHTSIPEAYCQAILRAGGIPVLIPFDLDPSLQEQLTNRLDGVVFSGGGDIHPSFYNGQPHPLVDEVDTARDQLEIDLLKQTIRVGKPFFGICRGLQLINVALGGSLYEDLLDQRPQALRHQYAPEFPRNYLAHSVQLEANSQIGSLIPRPKIQVNSLHHQGIDRLAPDLQASGYAPDGLIEAVELPGYSFGLAIQWHPEWLTADQDMQRLFSAFIRACQLS